VTRRLLAILLTALMGLAACIPPRPSPSQAPPTLSPTASVAPTGDAGSPTASAGTGVVVDPALLELLPAEVAGVPLLPDAETAAEIAAEPSIAPFVSAVAIAAAFAPVATETGSDYVVVTVARLKPGQFGDLFYRGWRDTFDTAVCEQAGGVDGRAEVEIEGRRTYVGTCAGGVRTYHVHLPDSDVIVSMQGAGDGGFGERVVAGLSE
jgi:hypothetical protein